MLVACRHDAKPCGHLRTRNISARCVRASSLTPDELAAHVRAALEWTKANRDLNPANAVIIYAWNEHDEGGWLQPTLGADGKPNNARIKALEQVLRSNALPKP